MKGIRLVSIGLTSWIVFTIIAILLWLSTFSMEKVMAREDKLQNLGQQYQNLAADLLESSKYLTDEARAFVITGDIRHLNNYVQQIETLRSREITVRDSQGLNIASKGLKFLENYREASEKLVKTDLRAMRLALEARKTAPKAIPKLISSSVTTTKDELLSPTSKLEKARLLLFEADYETNRRSVYQSITAFKQSVMSDLLKEKMSTNVSTTDTINLQVVLAIVILVGIAGVLIIIYLQMTRPIEGYIKALENDQDQNVNLVPRGTKEMRVLAEAFNYRTNLLYASQEELTTLATTDFLTGSCNRRMLLELGAKEVMRSERYGYPLSVIMLDLDHFKKLNDCYGHHFGDRVLQFVVQKGQEILRPSDVFGRLGGEEFAVLLPETDGDTAVNVAERLRKEYEKARILTDQGQEVGFTVSIGLVSRKPGELSLENLFQRADQALYQAKNLGRNRCVKGD